MTVVALLTALWLGILTSLSPCPLATNVAAVGWLAGSRARPVQTVRAGLLYGIGRATTYALLGGLLSASLLAAVGTSRFLQHDFNRVLAPLLVLVGMVLLGLLPLRLPLRLPSLRLDAVGRRVGRGGGGSGAFLLGALFALSFCPVSAALFFGSLLSLAATEGSPWMLPAVYGLGTALPVLVLAVALALGTRRLGRIFSRTETLERLARTLTGILFVGAGLYLSWLHVLGPELARLRTQP